MMRFACSVLALAVVGMATISVRGEDKKEVTLKGSILCAKCALKEKGITKCTTAIVVKEDGKDVVYYFHDSGAKEEYHEEVCGGARKEGAVTGVVHKHDGKLMIKPSKVEYAKK